LLKQNILKFKMFYLKINEKIRSLIDLCKILKLGCRDYCKFQLIALDELELLRIELSNQKIKNITLEEFNEIKNSTEKIYFHSTHVCIHDNKLSKEKVAEQIQKEELEDLELENNDNLNNNANNNNIESNYYKSDLTKQRKKPDVMAKFRVAYDFINQDENSEEKLFAKNPNNNQIKESQNTLSYGINMLVSFFLLVLGSYYLGRDYLGWSQASTLKLTLVVTIVVFFAEAFLLIIKLSKEDNFINGKASDKIKKYSLAYQLNQKYRNSFLNKDNYKNFVNNKSKKD